MPGLPPCIMPRSIMSPCIMPRPIMPWPEPPIIPCARAEPATATPMLSTRDMERTMLLLFMSATPVRNLASCPAVRSFWREQTDYAGPEIVKKHEHNRDNPPVHTARDEPIDEASDCQQSKVRKDRRKQGMSFKAGVSEPQQGEQRADHLKQHACRKHGPQVGKLCHDKLSLCYY